MESSQFLKVKTFGDDKVLQPQYFVGQAALPFDIARIFDPGLHGIEHLGLIKTDFRRTLTAGPGDSQGKDFRVQPGQTRQLDCSTWNIFQQTP